MCTTVEDDIPERSHVDWLRERWGKGESPRQIAQETGHPLKSHAQVFLSEKRDVLEIIEVRRLSIRISPASGFFSHESNLLMGDEPNDQESQLDRRNYSVARCDT